MSLHFSSNSINATLPTVVSVNLDYSAASTALKGINSISVFTAYPYTPSHSPPVIVNSNLKSISLWFTLIIFTHYLSRAMSPFKEMLWIILINVPVSLKTPFRLNATFLKVINLNKTSFVCCYLWKKSKSKSSKTFKCHFCCTNSKQGILKLAVVIKLKKKIYIQNGVV